MTTVPSMDLEILQSVLKAWDEKVKADQSPFWKSLANSYHSREQSDFGDQKFISSISFYPGLIKELIEHIGREKNISVGITFFSTLLPRHYWNFPIIKPLKFPTNGNPKNYYFSSSPKYLEEYRREICNLIKSDQKKFSLKRVIILSDKERYFLGTRLFSVADFEKDNKFFIKEKEIESHKIAWKQVEKELEKINAYSIGIEKQTLRLLFNEKSSGLMSKELENTLKKLMESEYHFYNFYDSAKNKRCQSDENISVLKFYLDNLHSNEKSSRVFVVGNRGGRQIILGKPYKKFILKDLPLSSEFNPDLGVIEIIDNNTNTTSKIILNTYMDIIKNIVKMEVITDGHPKFEVLNKDVDYILENSKDQFLSFFETAADIQPIIKKRSGNKHELK